MSTLSINIPDSYHKMVKTVSKEDKISINQFIASAIGEKLSAMQTAAYLQKRAERGSREKFLAVLNNVPNTEPEEYDK
jgi:copG/DNA-binding domain-containing protein